MCATLAGPLDTMLPTSLLLNRPIPRGSIELGRLVLDPKYPDHDFCQPSFRGGLSDASSAATNPAFSPDVAIQRLENFHQVLQRTRGTRLHLSLLNLLSAAPSAAPAHSSTTVTSTGCIIHQLRDPGAYFAAACRDTTVRAWLEKESQRPYSTVYLVCGFEALTDARVELARHHKTDLTVSAAVSAAAIAGATGVPAAVPMVSGLDVGGSLSLTSEASEKIGYIAAGEQVFAVQYRRIRFSWFSTQKVDKVYLEKGNRWKSFLSERAGRAGEDVEDGVHAEVAEPIALPDLLGMYESFESGGEQILYRVDEEVVWDEQHADD